MCREVVGTDFRISIICDLDSSRCISQGDRFENAEKPIGAIEDGLCNSGRFLEAHQTFHLHFCGKRSLEYFLNK